MDDTSFLKRFGRIASVTGKVGGVAAKHVGATLTGSELDWGSVLTDVLGELKGPAMKVGQILAMVPGLLPEDVSKQLLALHADAPPMGWPFVRRRMAFELGKDWQDYFLKFDQSAASAASLGQVHKAELLNGDVVACKLQYPNMQSIIEGDLAQLGILLSMYERRHGILDTQFVQEEIKTRLFEELDYENEVRNIQHFQSIFQNASLPIAVPTVVDDLCTNRLITMNWVDGYSLMQSKEWDLERRKQVGKNLFKAWYVPLYQFGVLHGDPHFGNYKIAENGDITLLDFGCVRSFSKETLLGVNTLYEALKSNNVSKAKEAYELWGFDNLTPNLVDALNIWARFLFEPLIENKVRPLVYSNDTGKEAAKAVMHALKEHGKVKPPHAFVFMDRAAVGIGSAMIHLNIELNWHELFNEVQKN